MYVPKKMYLFVGLCVCACACVRLYGGYWQYLICCVANVTLIIQVRVKQNTETVQC